jgi:hypothetical protein
MKLLETLYENFEKGKISKEEIKKQTLEIVVKEKKYFRLYNLDNDFESEVLIMLNSQLDRILATFDSTKSSYSTYIVYVVETIKKNIYLKTVKYKSQEAALIKYASEEQESYLSEQTPEYNINKDKLNINFNKLVNEYSSKNLSTKLKVLVLILKSCNYLTDNHLTQLSDEYKIPIMEINALVKIAKKQMQNKIIKNQIMNIRKNRLYILKNRYMNQLIFLENKSLIRNQIEKSLDFTNKTLSEYNSKNQEKAISPSNSDIGKILNIPYHRVNAFLTSINKKYGKNYKNKLSC